MIVLATIYMIEERSPDEEEEEEEWDTQSMRFVIWYTKVIKRGQKLRLT